jgi:ceramide glucosyltransferase
MLACVAGGYQLVALLACVRQWWRKPAVGRNPQPVSMLKPVRGLDPGFYAAIRSHATQEYGAPFEMLFGAADAEDPALVEVRRLQVEFPGLAIRIVPIETSAPNAKVGVLIDLARAARYPLLLVNDSDIVVPPGYLQQVTAPLEQESVGIVTALYRARAASTPGWWEAFGIAIDFAPSVLVAPLVGVKEFGLGATLVFRAAQLEAIGGFHPIGDYLADDYQLAKRITQLGTRAWMSEVVVETNVGDTTWAGVWRHQVRWARTIRVSRGEGYLGLPVTHTGLWILAALLGGFWKIALGLTIIRSVTAFVAGAVVLRSPVASMGFWLAPLWDLWAFAVWLAGLTGSSVVWRDSILRLSRDGKLLRQEP